MLTVSDGKLTDADSVLVTTTTNHPPLVDAGKDQQLPAGSSVALNGSATDADQDPLTFYWSFGPLPKGSTAAFKDASKPQTSFTADKEGSYTVILTANDGNFSVNDTLVVTATHVNQPPVANAGPDGKSDLNTPYILSGSGTDPENSPLTYSWTLVNKPAGSTASIKSPTSASTSLVPDKPGSYTATLIVSDGSLPSAPDQVVITTNPVDVTTINPTSGPENIMVTISGKNFSNVAAENIVKFNGVTAVVTSAGYTSLDVTVPKGAGTGIVSVTVNGVTDNGPIFTYILTGVVATLAQFNSPYGLASDPSGNIYIADYNSNLIRKMAPNGTLTTIAGDGTAGYFDSKLPQSKFNHPAGLVYDASHNSLYVCDRDNQCIRKVDLTLGIVTTVLGFPQAGFADGKKPTAQFNSPIGIARDAAGNLYIGDAGNHRIRKIVGDTIVSTFSGNGTAGLADGSAKATKFNAPSHLTIDATNFLYVADALNHAIRKVDTNGNSTTIAGNGTSGFVSANGTNARFNLPFGISIDGSKNLYVSDFNNHSIRKVTPAGDVTTVAGNGTSGYAEGAGSTARFNQPCGVVFTSNFVYVADFINQRVRRIQFE
ncbi:MAG: PKD domain-containing protein [Bacteroidota bacterium]